MVKAKRASRKDGGDGKVALIPAVSNDSAEWTPSEGPSLTSTMVRHYDGNQPTKCPKCLFMVVPEEQRVSNVRQCLHSLCCCLCVRKNWFGCKDCNEDLKDIIMVCPRCQGVIASLR